MPTYQYSCTECGHFLEAVQSFSDDSLTVCPQCRGRLRKVFNAVGVVFKGSGFYRNDSRDSNGSAASGPTGDSSAGSDSDSKSTSTPDSDSAGTSKPDSSASTSGSSKSSDSGSSTASPAGASAS